MRIRSQIILSMVSAAALIGLVGGVAIFTQIAATKYLGLTEATNVARELADTIVFKTSDGTPSLFERPDALKQFMEHQHRRMRRDFLVLDRNKNVVAHAADEEHKIGEKFDHDPGNEIGQTLEDGVPRKFVDPEEVNAILAVPIEYPEDTIIGAVLLEYDPVLHAAEERTNSLLWLVGLSANSSLLLPRWLLASSLLVGFIATSYYTTIAACLSGIGRGNTLLSWLLASLLTGIVASISHCLNPIVGNGLLHLRCAVGSLSV